MDTRNRTASYTEYHDLAVSRWWDRVVASGPDDCWEWVGSVLPYGYGMFWPDGRAGGKVYAHRFAIMVFQGEPIPPGYEVDHICKNTGCANPRHLRVVTQADNKRFQWGWISLDGLWYCGVGHPMTEDNLRGTGGTQMCRPCFNIRRKAWRHGRIAAGLRPS